MSLAGVIVPVSSAESMGEQAGVEKQVSFLSGYSMFAESHAKMPEKPCGRDCDG
jgi:hypothetical protein